MVRPTVQVQSDDTLRPGIYAHFKNKEYEVLGTARHSESEEEFVIYRCVSDASQLWIRPKAMFLERVEVDGVMVPRFRYVCPTELL